MTTPSHLASALGVPSEEEVATERKLEIARAELEIARAELEEKKAELAAKLEEKKAELAGLQAAFNALRNSRLEAQHAAAVAVVSWATEQLNAVEVHQRSIGGGSEKRCLPFGSGSGNGSGSEGQGGSGVNAGGVGNGGGGSSERTLTTGLAGSKRSRDTVRYLNCCQGFSLLSYLNDLVLFICLRRSGRPSQSGRNRWRSNL